MKLFIATVAAAMTLSVAHAEILTPERVFASPDLSGPQARGVALAPDGSAVTYLKAKADDVDVNDLWIADVSGGEPRVLIDGRALSPEHHELSEAEKSRRERLGLRSRGVVEYHWDDEGKYILAPVQGDLWLYERASGAARRLTNTPGDEIDGKISPKGGFASYVRDDNLYLMPLTAGGAERALTAGGTELKSWGTAEFIAQEELHRFTGYWWSPDETKIALTHVDQSGVDVIDRVDIGAEGGTIVHQRYPRVGRPNAVVELYVADVATGARVKVDLGPSTDIYLGRANWAKDGKTLYVQRLTRDQKQLDVLAVDPATGASHVILSETSPHWVALSEDMKPLKDGAFLWSSERDGNKHLYLYAGDGKLIRQITHGDWPVADLEGIDEARHVAIFGASKDTPIERRLYEVSWLKPGEPKALTPAGGWWSADVAKSGGAFAGSYSDPKTPPRTGFYKADGTLVRWIEENPLNAHHPFWPYHDRLSTPEFGTLKASDGQTLHWMMRKPAGFNPARKYPVIVQVYGGPASALVEKHWASPADQVLLDAGYILFALDNRGTPNRSVAFKTALDRKTGGPDVEDQLAGAAYLKTLPFVDGDHLGVTGFSNGGYMTLMLLTVPGGPFAAGVAGAPVTDWTLYDTAYTERYMGTPKDNPIGYRDSQVISRLANLKPGSLLLIHGMADDNVIFENSTRVLATLQGKGIPFEMMTYPGLRHRTGWTSRPMIHRTHATLDFFDRKLKPQH
ncbi:S9 family peptidase [Phenylobacterium sp.]|jgi:dipeptidyl-peptidase-4|uniref:S9 family peptidase n=1 Tax=Phenylobacterium sp. TaxID=1871053 RepID=UPI002E313D07|nr:S9 family peptidase [Phenylobacterium sp.]HEX3365522.1 S9 family peptidase [Phenylobacterium sp.]